MGKILKQMHVIQLMHCHRMQKYQYSKRVSNAIDEHCPEGIV